ncbi:hypothetical protein T11_12583 [Trichinella zimbabwensis]|uniref:Uncharacterized protein n=1 Tax=Trichinella zimbabwensis TaxID=268475 RepID=A0A0V1GMR4_9BILA|nr:hypothetical protein T11_12583 [Trichinella zimbabwensis]
MNGEHLLVPFRNNFKCSIHAPDRMITANSQTAAQTSLYVSVLEFLANEVLLAVEENVWPGFCTWPLSLFCMLETDQQFPNWSMHCCIPLRIFAAPSLFLPLRGTRRQYMFLHEVLISKQCLLRGWCKLYLYNHFSPT